MFRAIIASAIVLAGLLGGSGAAAANPGDAYNDGLATAICQLLVEQRWAPDRVADELAASFPREIIATKADAWTMLRWAVATKCPGAA